MVALCKRKRVPSNIDKIVNVNFVVENILKVYIHLKTYKNRREWVTYHNYVTFVTYLENIIFCASFFFLSENATFHGVISSISSIRHILRFAVIMKMSESQQTKCYNSLDISMGRSMASNADSPMDGEAENLAGSPIWNLQAGEDRKLQSLLNTWAHVAPLHYSVAFFYANDVLDVIFVTRTQCR